MKYRLAGLLAAFAALALMLPWSGDSNAQDKLRFGMVISKTGPNTAGAAVTLLPNYRLWIAEVNAAGGLMVKGKRMPIELIEYDDRSQSEEVVRLTERLINQDKVDFILPPWGTGFNLAVAPLLAKAGYPHLAVTTTAEDIPQFAKRWPNAFFFTDLPSAYVDGLVQILKAMRDKGQIGSNVAIVGVSDAFGLELIAAGRKAFPAAGFKLVMDKTYPLGSQDLGQIITEAARANPDAFVAFSYPPDTMGLTDQAKTLRFNPKVFYAAVATAFPIYKQRFGAGVEGIMGPGGWDAAAPLNKSFMERFKKVNAGAEPDRWASPLAFISLQMLQQAIERVGTERGAVIKEIATGSFDTIYGPLRMEQNRLRNQFVVGQWQDGEFNAVWPQSKAGAKPVRFPKPAWQ